MQDDDYPLDPRVWEVDDIKKFPATYKVWLVHKNGNFLLYVGNNMTRNFTMSTLPDHIRAALAMIHAVGLEVSEDSKELRHVGLSEGYTSEGENLYAIIIPAGTLQDLRGKPIHG